MSGAKSRRRCSRFASSAGSNKEEILEAYLNRIYLGNGHYGVEAACPRLLRETGIGAERSPKARSLAGLIPCPSVCSPRVSPTIAKSRRDIVLKAMHDNGAITEQAYGEAAASQICSGGRAPRFVCARRITSACAQPRRT